MKRNYFIAAGLFTIAGVYFIIDYIKSKCEYPVFDLNYQGKVVEACFQTSSIIQHAHKNSIMLEITSPSAMARGESLYFENNRELANFACQILLQSAKKQPTHFDFTSAKKRPHLKTISIRNHETTLYISEQSSIIETLFCTANK